MDNTRTVRGSTRINTKFYSEVCMTEATRYRGESNFIMDLKLFTRVRLLFIWLCVEVSGMLCHVR
jgi:hypothetical protein